MGLRQEQIVFLASAGVLGLLAWSVTSDRPAERRGRGGEAREFEHFEAPRVDRRGRGTGA